MPVDSILVEDNSTYRRITNHAGRARTPLRAADGVALGGMTPAGVREVAERLIGMGVAAVMIKLGNQGAYLRVTSDQARLARCGRAAATLRGQIVNDLAAAAEQVRPQLARLRERAEGLTVGNVAMTGSGSTLFVLADSERLAAEHRAFGDRHCAPSWRARGGV